MARLCALVYGLAFVVATVAGPLGFLEESTKCAAECPDTTKFSYHQGKTYEYKYQADIKTHIPGSTEEHSSLHMHASVHIEVLSKCEMALRLSDVSLQETNPKSNSKAYVNDPFRFKRALMEKSLRFAFLDGKIANVCPDDEDPWVLNIKRGIVSSLQNTMHSLDTNTKVQEVDVVGNCPVEYKVLETSRGVRKVHKTKDMLACTGRTTYEGLLQSTPYTAPSGVQSLPVLKSWQECDQEINQHDRLIQTVCTERHVFRPFSKHHSGASTEIQHKLWFRRELPNIKTKEDLISYRVSLAYEHVPSEEERSKDRARVESAVKEMCKGSAQGIRPESPGFFIKLVKEMRRLDATTLKAAYRKVAADRVCDKAVEYFLSAIPMLGTSAAMHVLRDLMVRKEVKGKEADMWFTMIAFTPNPTTDILRELKPLLSNPDSGNKAALSVSSLVHGYCKNNADCGDEPIVQEIIKILEGKLGYNCRPTSEDQYQEILISLKAIGNAGHAGRATKTLNRCMKNADNPTDIRIAAIQAFHRIPCTEERDELMTLYKDRTVDSELRINAYLALMQCPTKETLYTVQMMLQKEDINQVGSFVWTHLTNLAETSDPLKQKIREILLDKELKKTFDLDKRKFSRNIELSAFSEMLNTGLQVESNLIWSPRSFIPRSANLNLTIDMFGHSINFLEIGGRVEGLEYFLQNIFASGKESRSNRAPAAKNKLNALDQKFNLQTDKPQGSYFIKFFGNELRFANSRNIDIASLKEKFNYLNWLVALAEEHKMELAKNTMFLDSAMIVPTSTGMPLRLSAQGAASLDLKMKGKMDVRKLVTSPRSCDIQANLEPSAAIQITGSMAVDAHVSSTGLTMVSTLHTSTATHGKLEIKDGKIFDMEVKMPKDKMEIVDVKTEFFIHYKNTLRKQKMITADRLEKKKCIAGNLVKALGIEVCGELSIPRALKKADAPWFPFTGPATGKLIIHKRDSFSAYHLQAKLLQDKTKRNGKTELIDVARLSFNTPGSRYDREFLADYSFNYATWDTRLNLRSPWKKVDISSTFQRQADLKRLNARLVYDDTKEYSLMAEVHTDSSRKQITKYTPKVELKVPQLGTMMLAGTVNMQKKPKISYNVDLNLETFSNEVVTAKGKVDMVLKNKRTKYDVNLNVNSKVMSGRVTGSIDRIQSNSYTSYSSRLNAQYQRNGQSHRVILNNKVKDMSRGGSIKYAITSSLTGARDPLHNYDVTASVEKAPKTIALRLDAGIGNDDKKRIKIVEVLSDKSSGKNKNIEGSMKIDLPFKDVSYELTLKHLHEPKNLHTVATLQYSPRDKASIDILSKYNRNPLLLANHHLKLHYPGRAMSFVDTIEETKPKEYHHDMTINLDKNEKITMNSVYKMTPMHHLVGTLSVPNVKPIAFEVSGTKYWRNFKGGVGVKYGTTPYSVDTTFTHRSNPQGLSAKSTVEAVWQTRKVKVNVEAKRDGLVYSGRSQVAWDATSNPDKNVKVNGEVDLTSAKPSLQVEAHWYPHHFIELKSDGSIHKNGWWHPHTKIEGKARLVSSFKNFEDINVVLKHDRSDRQIVGHVETSWKPNHKVLAHMHVKKENGWKNVESSIMVNTPFPKYQVIQGAANYKLDGNALTCAVKVARASDVVEMNLSGKLDPSQGKPLEGQIFLKTPFEGYRDMSATVKHQINGRYYLSETTAKWGPGQEIKSKFTMTHHRHGWYINNNGEFSLTTPFKPWTNSKLVWSHRNNNKIFITNVVSHFMNEKTAFEFDGRHKASQKRDIEVQSSLKGPYANYDLKFKHEHELKSWKNIKTEATLNYGQGQTITYEQEVHVDPGKYYSKKIKFTSPFRYYEHITSDFFTKKVGDKYTVHKEIKWGTNKKIAVDGEMSIKWPLFSSKMRMTTPFESMERVEYTIVNEKDGKLWVQRGEMSYGTKKYEVQTKFGWNDEKKASFLIKTPYRVLRSFNIKAELKGALRDFSFLGEVDFPPLSKISLETSADTANLDDIKATFKFYSPFRQAPYFGSTLSHKKRGGGKYISDLSLGWRDRRIAVSNTLVYKKNIFDTRTILQLEPRKKITLDLELKQLAKIEGKIGIRTPYSKLRNAFLTFNHKGPWTAFESNGQAMYNGKKMNAHVDFNKAKVIRGTFKLNTPYKIPKTLVVSFHHNGGLKQFKNGIVVTMNNKKFGSNTEFKLQNYNLQLRANLGTPYPQLKTAQITYNHNGPLNSFRCNGEAEYNNKKYTSRLEYKITESSHHIHGAVTTPYSQLEKASFTYDRKGPLSDFSSTALAEYNEKKITSNMELKVGRTNIHVHGDITTPFSQLKNAQVTYDHSGPLNNFRCNGVAVLNNKKITTNLQLNRISAHQGKFQLYTPFPAVRSVVVQFQHNTDIKHLKHTGSVEFNGKTVSEEISFDMTRPTSIRFNTDIQLPFQKISTIHVNVHHNGPLTNFLTKTTLRYNDKTFSTEAKYRMENAGRASHHDAFLKLETPYPKIGSGEVKVEHHKDTRGSNGNMYIIFKGKKRFDFDYEYRSGRKHNARVTMKLPKPWEVRANYVIGTDTFTGDAVVHWDTRHAAKKAEFDISLKNHQDRHITERSIMLAATIPTRTVKVGGSYELAANRLKHKVEVQLEDRPERKMAYQIDISQRGGRGMVMRQGQLDFTSPIASFTVESSLTPQPGRMSGEISITSKKTGEKLVVKDVLVWQASQYKNTLTIQHPRLRRDVNAVIDAHYDVRQIRGKALLEYEKQKFEIMGNIADASTPDMDKYVYDYHMAHPASRMDYSVKGSIYNGRSTAGSQVEMRYLASRTRQTRICKIHSEINKIKKEFVLEGEASGLFKPSKLFARVTDLDKRNQEYSLSIKGRHDNTEKLNADIHIKAKEPSFDLTIHHHTGGDMHLYGKYLNPSTIQLEATRSPQRGGKIREALASVRLNSSRLIHARVHFRPSMYQDIKEQVQEMYVSAAQAWQGMARFAAEEYRYKSMLQELALKPIVQLPGKICKYYVTPAVQAAKREYQDMYSRDEIYTKTIVDYITKKAKECSVMLDASMKKVAAIAGKYKVQMVEHMDKLKQMHLKTTKHFQKWHNNVKNQMEELRKRTDAWSKDTNRRVREYFNDKTNWVGSLQDRLPPASIITDKINHHVDIIHGKIKEWVSSTKNHPRVQQIISSVGPVYIRHRDNMKDKYEQYKYYVSQTMAKKWEELMKRPDVQSIKAFVAEIVEQFKSAYDYYDVEEKMLKLVKDFKNNGIRMTIEHAKNMITDYVHPEKTRITIWDPQHGEFQGELYIPVGLKNLKTIPLKKARNYWLMLKNQVLKYMPHDDWIFWDTFYAYKPSPNPIDWVPPFRAHAFVSGTQHYMTFDKKFYEFEGECSYLLARDFVDGNFSVLVNYKKAGRKLKKSIAVISDNKQIEVFNDFKVVLDGKRIELPMTFADTMVRRTGQRIVITSKKGLAVDCDLPHDRCTVEMSGWYYGKTAGALGTYDNEPSNDFTKSDGTHTSSARDFVSSWAVGNCRSTSNSARRVPVDTNTRTYRLCARYFKDQNSPFRYCFKQVESSAFLQMCLNEINPSSNRLPTESDMCKVSALYVDECKRAGVPIRVPSKCVRCDKPGKGYFLEGQTESVRDKQVPRSADVIFVVEEKKCNKGMSRQIQPIADSIDKALESEGLKNNMFGVVGFGRDGILGMPHSQTMQSKLFNRRSKLRTAIQSLNFDQEDGSTDVLAAIRYAAMYPFRTGVSKTVIVLPCSTCKEQSASYTEMQQLLLNRDIHLHVLAHGDFQLKSTSPKTSFMFGVSKDKVYTVKDFPKLKGDPALRQFVSPPKDLCLALSEETDGSLFTSTRLLTYRTAMQKKFRGVLASLVAEKAQPSSCQICDCVADESGNGKSVCHRCQIRKPIYMLLPLLPNPNKISEQIKKDVDEAQRKRPHRKMPHHRSRKSRN